MYQLSMATTGYKAYFRTSSEERIRIMETKNLTSELVRETLSKIILNHGRVNLTLKITKTLTTTETLVDQEG